jgi:outer membrane beta-barrel protein
MFDMTDPRPARRLTQTASTLCAAVLAATTVATASGEAHAAPHPAVQALNEFRGDTPDKNVIQNKFFVKENRFEVAPAIGLMPNNAFVTNVYGGAMLAYHFSESFAAEGTFLYAPNTGESGVKGLTKTLVLIAHDTGTGNFQQPLDRLQLGALFAARWSPVYGKINLIGEGVANFDVYGTGGVGLMLMTKDTATYNSDFESDELASPVAVDPAAPTAAHPAVNVGMGINFFINQSIAFKLDGRTALYVAPEPDYGNNEGVALENRLYTPFLTTAGVSIFFPKMKPRYNF